jgi:hypothetical protein
MFAGIFICLIILCSCTAQLKPWKTVWYYEENLYKHDESWSSGHPDNPNISQFSYEKYSNYYIDDLFVGIISQKPWGIGAYDHVYYFNIGIRLQAYNRNNYKKIIIHNISIISKSRINYTEWLNENFPLEIEINEIFNNKITPHTETVQYNLDCDIQRNYLDLYTHIGDKFILEKDEEFTISVNMEIIKNDGQQRKEIYYFFKPKINRGLIRWKLHLR